ncbi:MAG TPA: universal stress protein [Puia sp.]|jgi:nucleotide-binding universal stress UspA family protein|nr:universal stress protein [Puia sp.]
MKQILVATDFSACATNAMEYAMDLAKVLQAEVCALHAIGSFEGVFNNTYNALYIEEYHNSKRQALVNWAATFTTRESFKSVPVTTSCEVGSVSAVIMKYIDANPVEMLVMGTMGSTGISGIFGSNASTMVEKTRIPTLIVPLESKYAVHPVVTLATDFSSPPSGEDVMALTDLLSALEAKKLFVVNVVDSATWTTNEEGEKAMKERYPEAELEFRYIKEDSPIEGIVNFISGSQTDIVCLVKRHHGLVYRLFNTSTVNKVLNRSIKAVLVLHA